MSEVRETETVEICADLMDELRHLADQHRRHGAPNRQESVEDLVNYVLSAVVDGYRRPGSWEAGLLEPMGLVPYAEDSWAEEPEDEDLDDDEEDRFGYARPLPGRGERGARTHPMARASSFDKAPEPFYSGAWRRSWLWPRSRFMGLPSLAGQQGRNRTQKWEAFCKTRPAQAKCMVDWPVWKYVARRV